MNKLKQWIRSYDLSEILEVTIPVVFCLFGLWVCWIL